MKDVKVKALIEKLQVLNPEMVVYVEGQSPCCGTLGPLGEIRIKDGRELFSSQNHPDLLYCILREGCDEDDETFPHFSKWKS